MGQFPLRVRRWDEHSKHNQAHQLQVFARICTDMMPCPGSNKHADPQAASPQTRSPTTGAKTFEVR